MLWLLVSSDIWFLLIPANLAFQSCPAGSPWAALGGNGKEPPRMCSHFFLNPECNFVGSIIIGPTTLQLTHFLKRFLLGLYEFLL